MQMCDVLTVASRSSSWRALILVAFLVMSCSPAAPPTPPSTAAAAPSTFSAEVGSLVPGPCAFALPSGIEQGEDVECATLTVPERRDDTLRADRRVIRLAVAVFRGTEASEPRDPVIYLSGGPGASALEALRYEMPQAFEAVLAQGHDLVVFDQRGVGRSRPALDCPEADEMALELVDRRIEGRTVSKDEAQTALVEAFVACGQRLGQGADLSAYKNAESARDILDLVRGLGYDQVSLWGGSYGTRLALEVMRQTAETEDGGRLRSVVLDAVYPPDVDLYAETPANFERALDRLFESCAANPVCNANYPDLGATFFETVDRLNRDPVPSTMTDLRTGDEIPDIIDGDLLTGMVFQFLYSTEVKLLLPDLIYDVSVGDFAMLENFRSGLLAQQSFASRGMMFSVQCNEEIAFSSPDAVRDVEVRYPELSGTFAHGLLGEMAYRVCERWDAGRAAPSANEPVVSDIPTLILTGEFDPITPPAWGRHVAETLTHAYAFEYPGVGHGATAVKGCPQEMFLAFLADPSVAPDDTCIYE